MTSDKQVNALKAHLALNVRNVERSMEFYKKMLGIEPSKIRSGYAKFDVQNPPLNLTLNEYNFAERGALRRPATCWRRAKDGRTPGSSHATRCKQVVATPCRTRPG
jgi:hypothetical protein